mmetsp:Transcript_88536/g.230774  ORF Transcript_88536/g.230774 Transcript_88536/m.230774 type:complete len:212 (+) Transcript_88536:932-1567(+)
MALLASFVSTISVSSCSVLDWSRSRSTCICNKAVSAATARCSLARRCASSSSYLCWADFSCSASWFRSCSAASFCPSTAAAFSSSSSCFFCLLSSMLFWTSTMASQVIDVQPFSSDGFLTWPGPAGAAPAEPVPSLRTTWTSHLSAACPCHVTGCTRILLAGTAAGRPTKCVPAASDAPPKTCAPPASWSAPYHCQPPSSVKTRSLHVSIH